MCHRKSTRRGPHSKGSHGTGAVNIVWTICLFCWFWYTGVRNLNEMHLSSSNHPWELTCGAKKRTYLYYSLNRSLPMHAVSRMLLCLTMTNEIASLAWISCYVMSACVLSVFKNIGALLWWWFLLHSVIHNFKINNLYNSLLFSWMVGHLPIWILLLREYLTYSGGTRRLI